MIYLLFTSIIVASTNSILLHKVNFAGDDDKYKFNMLGSAVWCILLLAVNGFKININSSVLIWGLIYGITQMLFMLFKTLAMNTGPVSIVTLVGNVSFMISTFFSFFVWNEPITVTDILGLFVLLTGVVLSTYKNNGAKFGKKCAIYSFFFLVFAASVGITFKAYGKYGDINQAGNMMIISAIVMLILNLTLYFKSNRNYEKHNKFSKNTIILALFTGALSCIYNRLNIYLSSVMSSVTFFPSFNGGVILLSAALSFIVLKEKISKQSIIGILIGIIGILIIGIF